MARQKNEEVERVMSEHGVSRAQAYRILKDANKQALVELGAATPEGRILMPRSTLGGAPFDTQIVTQQEFDALVARVDDIAVALTTLAALKRETDHRVADRIEKLEKGIGDRLNAKQPVTHHEIFKGNKATGRIFDKDLKPTEKRHPTLGERSSKNELPRRI